jgi:aminoglycoside phosphotransferase (APT) family kinase protein
MGYMPPEPPHDLREVVALVADETVLTVERDGVRSLPRIDDSEGWPSIKELQEFLQVPGAVLLGPPRRYALEPVTTLQVLADAARADSPPRAQQDGEEWLPLDRLAELVDPPELLTDVRTTYDEWTGAAPWPDRRPGWLRRGWFEEAEAWLDDQLGVLGLERSGPSVVLQMWSLATVLRTPVTTSDGRPSAVVLKATCEWFALEPTLTRAVGTLGAGCVPRVLAIEEARSWTLMEALHDVEVSDDLDVRLELALDVAPRFARLQLASLPRLDELRAAGLPDRGRDATIEALERLMVDSIELDELSDDEREQLRAAEPYLRGQLTALYAAGIPPALTHGDLHLHNVARGGEGTVAYDWSDASISHPFIDGFHLATRVREEDRPAVYEAYLTPWVEAFPDADVDEAMRLAKLADRIFEAISYEGIQRHQEDASRWEMNGITARILRELATAASAG